MTSEFYFFDQYSSASHVGGVRRMKRDLKDLNRALFHVKVALSVEEEEDSDKTERTTPTLTTKSITDNLLQTFLRRLKTPIIPEVLTKELDSLLQIFPDKSKPTTSSSEPLQPTNEETIIDSLPKISLPAQLILQFHSTWSDLIQNTVYRSKVWQTKAGEEAWRRYVHRKRSEQLKCIPHQDTSRSKSIIHRRKSSRVSPTSTTNLAHRPSITINSKKRPSRAFSRGSLLSLTHLSPDHLQHLKSIAQGTSENVVEPIKNGIHVEFKLSTQIDQTKPELNEQKIALFDVPKPENNLGEDIITLAQDKCKQLLAEMKQKILATNEDFDAKQPQMCRIRCYEGDRHARNRTNPFVSNEANRRQKSKFVLAILRNEIPEKYQIDIDTMDIKNKCSIELVDGSSQIYYPSGRLAVLRLRPPHSTTLFFDDTHSTANQFLGLVTSTGNVLSMQPTFHARFVTNDQHEYAYLCHGKTGLIEKQISFSLIDKCSRESISIDGDALNLPSIENTVQLQLNPFMQLEYRNRSNIRFAFHCQNEQFQYELGVPKPIRSSTLVDLTTAMLGTKNNSPEKKLQTKAKLLIRRPSSVYSTDQPNISSDKQSQRLFDEQGHSRQLPVMRELVILRKRIRQICDNWLTEYRTTLGIIVTDEDCLSDLSVPSPPTLIETKQQMIDIDSNPIVKQSRYVPLLARGTVYSLAKPECDVIADVIEQFIPHSDAGRAIKQRIYTKKRILPLIK